ncbi:MAG: OmpA family protein [Burkholderiaceae bacterium]|nr:OmpA family protein [Ottowia sp.]MCP5257449.1 OmpA family protein [Burkholderiaceae bacterium]HRW71049.1 OmpA family protein [Ottowia sp.]
MRPPTAMLAFVLFVAGPALADTTVPTQDLKGLGDPPGLSRYTGSVLLYRNDADYDELRLPVSRPVDKGGEPVAPKVLEARGQRSSLQYLVPPGRSPLEVLRNYQQAYKAQGFETVYECAGPACGASEVSLHGFDLGRLLVPANYASAIGDNSPAACAGGAFVGDLRYAVLQNKASGAAMALMSWKPGNVSAYCDEAAFKKHASVFLVRVQPQARAQTMETLSASELGQSLTATGKVAVYGILFDTNKSDIKPESRPSLEQIGALMKQNPGIRLHVVGHTDNVGGFDANLGLSKRRAEAVAAALTKDFGVARERLTANGVASLAPVQSNADEAGRARNRRVELVLQ